MKLCIHLADRKEGIYFIIKEWAKVRFCWLINFNISSALRSNLQKSHGSILKLLFSCQWFTGFILVFLPIITELQKLKPDSVAPIYTSFL